MGKFNIDNAELGNRLKIDAITITIKFKNQNKKNDYDYDYSIDYIIDYSLSDNEDSTKND